MKKNQGITLIALVVTIIILLILAGVSIAMFTGDGIFSRATLGAQKYDEAQKAENSVIEGWIAGYDSVNQGQQVVAPTIEIVGGEKAVYGGNVQVKITTNNANVMKETHYIISGAQAKGDTTFKGVENITLTQTGEITVKAWSIGFNDVRSVDAEKTVVINSAPPALASVEITNPEGATIQESGILVASLPQTMKAKVTHTSDYNDIDITKCKYTINNSSDSLGTDLSSYANTFTSNGQQIDITISAAQSYYIHILSSNQSAVRTETIQPISITEKRHIHTGNASSGGGCYTQVRYHQHTSSCRCNGTAAYRSSFSNGSRNRHITRYCTRCGYEFGTLNNYDGYVDSGYWGWLDNYEDGVTEPNACWQTRCGKSTSTPEGYSLGCGKTENSLDGYIIVY